MSIWSLLATCKSRKAKGIYDTSRTQTNPRLLKRLLLQQKVILEVWTLSHISFFIIHIGFLFRCFCLNFALNIIQVWQCQYIIKHIFDHSHIDMRKDSCLTSINHGNMPTKWKLSPITKFPLLNWLKKIKLYRIIIIITTKNTKKWKQRNG